MNKVVCHVCGTSYPENASQCPICGFARTPERSASEGSYNHVKGGRFSKSNVKKRNQALQSNVEAPVAVAKPAAKREDKAGAGSIIIAVILLLAIIAVVGYIALRFFLPNDYIFEGLDNLKLPSAMQQLDDELIDPVEEPEEDPETEPDLDLEEETPYLACISVVLDETEIQFDAIGDTFPLYAELEPYETDDVLYFTSDDETVATVDDYGVVTCVGEGTAVITASCGDAYAECTVICALPTEAPDVPEFTLNRKEITFDVEGQSWLLYSGEIPMSEIIWTSDDNNVATIEAGEVVAVGNGDTTVYGIYGDQKVSCVIHCKFDEEGSGDDGGISEAGEDAKRTYQLHNPNGLADDVTIKVGEEFKLMLVDENKKEVDGAEWKVDDETVCSYTSGVVKGLAKGTASITATYDGTTYTCIVRVVEP